MTPEIAPPKRSLNPVSIVLKEGTKVCQRQLVNEMLGPLVTEFARNLRARRPHLFSAASNPAFSVASRPSNSPDITRTPTSQRRPSARWSPLSATCSKWRRQTPPGALRALRAGSPQSRADVTADEGPATDAARPRRRGDRMSQREFVTLLGVAVVWPPAPDRRPANSYQRR